MTSTASTEGKVEHLKQAIGWREWIELPALGGARIKAKVDTGARTSALHACNIVEREVDGEQHVSFDLHPVQHDDNVVISCQVRVFEKRMVRNSGGEAEDRYVIVTPARLGDDTFDIELTLTQRDKMSFRMLLGRTAIRHRFLVNAGKSFLGGEPV